uniref:mTERF domain-containing protein, mitochondrial n=1 Tax=Odontella aurita TaxID=265563 RepID=A0A7S4MYU4_9STRA|mmetsp:Transcript_40378/g.121669  ORF Transcript_40378/g.121669 Transcript_40378/m.121669 type:complete len:735 (+) Transcript_40378:212-2416(+)|eukprot:CAMPEP_0113548934 /NCGR_PEP_ID=MMETSP0015_2-20120614/13162_1 /TAXON_ID=2838 /ORGANISM="Odontella" /LENGTH=734 /DNA_ID=CAMNT_0000449605 /DNA_START=77 /DNA_END=2281 /DNA_ORIENTATION=- /assembly_acc=CAM_ASM_000160
MKTWRRGAALPIALIISSERLIEAFQAPFTTTQSGYRRKPSAVRPPSFYSAPDTSGSDLSLDVSSVPAPTKDPKATSTPDIFDQPLAKPDIDEPLPSRAPRVDSALLRFLSAQKKDASLQNEIDGLQSGKALGVITTDLGQSTGTESDQKMKSLEVAKERENEGENFADASWMGRYNGNIIAQQLIAIGAEENEAFKAGQAVQRHILARTARRRIRKFLRERDRMWTKEKGEMQFTNGIVMSEGEEKMQVDKEDQYRCEDVITLFTSKGLNGKDVAAILEHTPSVVTLRTQGSKADSDESIADSSLSSVVNTGNQSAETLEGLMQLVFDDLLSITLSLKRYDARTVLRSCPGLLTKRGSQSAMQVVTLMKSLGVSASSLARDKKALPKLLSRSPAGLFRFVAFLSSEDVRMPVKSIGPFLRRKSTAQLLDEVAPSTMVGSTTNGGENNTNPMWDGLERADSAQSQRKRINSLYRSMASTADILRHDIGVGSLGKMVASYPNVLLLDISSQVVPVTEYLCDQIGIWEEDIPRVLESFPSVLETDKSQMDDVVKYMLSIGISEDSLGPIFRSFPSLLTLDVKNDMEPVVDFVRSIGVSNVGRFVTRLPSVLGYSVEKDLRPKWEYLTKVCRFDQFEVVRFPAYFSYPFERVIKTRYEYLRDVKRAPIQLMSVDEIVRFGDNEFARSVAGDSDEGIAFAAYAETRQKKRSSKKRRKENMDRSKKERMDTISRKQRDR